MGSNPAISTNVIHFQTTNFEGGFLVGKLTASLCFFPHSVWRPGLALDVPVPIRFSSEQEAACAPLGFRLGTEGVYIYLRNHEICVVPAKGLYFRLLKTEQNGSVFVEDETSSLPYAYVFAKIQDDLGGDYWGTMRRINIRLMTD